jgi:hypothetical protein
VEDIMRTVLRGTCAALLAMFVGSVAHYFVDLSQDVPDRAPVTVVEPPATWKLTPLPPVEQTPAPPRWVPDLPADLPPDVVPVGTAVTRPAQTFSVPDQPEPVDYRKGRIMEPWPRDSLENQRRRAHARCVAGMEDVAGQVVYCDRNYGPGRAGR